MKPHFRVYLLNGEEYLFTRTTEKSEKQKMY